MIFDEFQDYALSAFRDDEPGPTLGYSRQPLRLVNVALTYSPKLALQRSPLSFSLQVPLHFDLGASYLSLLCQMSYTNLLMQYNSVFAVSVHRCLEDFMNCTSRGGNTKTSIHTRNQCNTLKLAVELESFDQDQAAI
jgi:hypothetical protein